MAYNITRSDGTVLDTIADGTYNDTATSLTLVGRNFSNYGQIMTNNLVRLLENSAYSISPSNPISGQLWWNTADRRLRVYTGVTWKIVSSCTAQASGPVTTVAGDLWWDTAEEQLYVYNGTDPYTLVGWILVGPPYKKTKGKSGAIWEQIEDSTNVLRDVVSIYWNGVRTAIVSQNITFTPLVGITGFSTIQYGYNMNTAHTIWGTANNSSYLGLQPASNYLRSDIDDETAGALTITSNGGLTVGKSGNLQITTLTGGGVSVKNTKNNADIDFYANIGGTNTSVLNILGSTGRVTERTLTLTGTTTATSTGTGALIVGGGAGVAENLYVGGIADFAGNAYGVTQPALTADTTLATTGFVIFNSGFVKNKIYDGGNATTSTTYIVVNDTGTGNLSLVVDGTSIATGSASGLALANGATAATQSVSHQANVAIHQDYDNAFPGDGKVATTLYVGRATQYWSGSAKFVSADEPDAGVNDAGSADGDFWFQIES